MCNYNGGGVSFKTWKFDNFLSNSCSMKDLSIEKSEIITAYVPQTVSKIPHNIKISNSSKFMNSVHLQWWQKVMYALQLILTSPKE